MSTRSCVTPSGQFIYGLHRPRYTVANLRAHDYRATLGLLADGSDHDNRANFPAGAVAVAAADPIFEIPNPFPFRGTTYITKSWADARAADPASIRLPAPEAVSYCASLRRMGHDLNDPLLRRQLFATLPQPLLLTLATTSTDADDLRELAFLAGAFVPAAPGADPAGLLYREDARGRRRATIKNHELFEALANNPALPDRYKEAMVLRPGAQGDSEIVGEFGPAGQCHIFEYLRQNSYIPWGHYAANMADDAIRYRLAELSASDLEGLRHLYYQRSYTRMAAELGLPGPPPRRMVAPEELERLRQAIVAALAGAAPDSLFFSSTLWGWNYGFDYAGSHYRLHASHQQIHQQYALLPATVASNREECTIPSYACGDLVAEFIAQYRRENGQEFFPDYLRAIADNQRLDGDPARPASLIVYEDDHVLLFVPKAQTSQWELQLMTRQPVGNILEADRACRAALDRGILLAMRALTGLGARLISTIEYAKRFAGGNPSQRLLYAFLPKMPDSPGAFSEAQLRWINGHYPEDFALACRDQLKKLASDA